MRKTTISVTEAARNLADCVNRAHYQNVTFVLLKNDPVEGVGALLPISAKVKKVALIGPLADNKKEMLGAWAVTGDPKYVVTLRQALEERLGDRLLYAQGCDLLSGEDAAVLSRIDAQGQVVSD